MGYGAIGSGSYYLALRQHRLVCAKTFSRRLTNNHLTFYSWMGAETALHVEMQTRTRCQGYTIFHQVKTMAGLNQMPYFILSFFL